MWADGQPCAHRAPARTLGALEPWRSRTGHGRHDERRKLARPAAYDAHRSAYAGNRQPSHRSRAVERQDIPRRGHWRLPVPRRRILDQTGRAGGSRPTARRRIFAFAAVHEFQRRAVRRHRARRQGHWPPPSSAALSGRPAPSRTSPASTSSRCRNMPVPHSSAPPDRAVAGPYPLQAALTNTAAFVTWPPRRSLAWRRQARRRPKTRGALRLIAQSDECERYVSRSLSPSTPARMSPTQRTRMMSVDSPNRTSPATKTPAVPAPVQMA